MKAAIYARVSTVDQEPENQLQELRRYVEGRWCMNPLGLRSPETGILADLLGGTEPPRTTLWG